MDLENKNSPVSATEKSPKSPWRWLWRSLLLLILIPIILVLLLQIPKVQNYVVDKATNYLSDRLDAEVSIDHIDFSIRKGITINDFLVVDSKSDTLLQSGLLSVSLQKNLFSYFNNEIDLDGLTLENTFINVKRYADHPKSNLSTLLDKLKSDNEKTDNPERLKLDINNINLVNVKFISNDMLTGDFYYFEIPKGNIDLESIEKEIRISEINFDRPFIRIEKNHKGDLSLIADENIKEQVQDQLELEKTSLDTFALFLKSFDITNGKFSYHDNTKVRKYGNTEMDYEHFDFSSFNIDLDDFSYVDGFEIEGVLNNFSFQDQNGFNISQLKSDRVTINKRNIKFEEFLLKTDRTVIRDHLEFKFRSFTDFKKLEDKVILKVDLDRCNIAYSDLMYLVPRLSQSAVFIKNKQSIAQISGNYQGRINNLSGKNIDISLGKSTKLRGAFSSRNLTKPEKTLLNLTVKDINTDFQDLARIIPGFNPPENFYKLGRLYYKGRFDGFLNDFVSLGDLKTDLGRASLDMRLDLKEGRDNARYSGQIAVQNFDLKKWSDNDDLGIVDFQATVKEGYGLTLDNASADLDALVNSVSYKGYEYKNVLMDGKIDKNNFIGDLLVEDEDINFSFKGDVHIVDGVPDLDFSAKINHIDLDKLNLVKGITSISGDVIINATGSDLSDIRGQSSILKLNMIRNDSLYTMDSVHVASYLVDNINRKVEVYTDVASGSLKGRFNLTTIVNDTKRILKRNYPNFLENLTVGDKTKNIQNFVFDIKLKSAHKFYSLLGLNDLEIDNISILGEVNNEKEVITAHAEIPLLNFNNNRFVKSFIDLETIVDKGSVLVSLDSSIILGFKTNPISITTELNNDQLAFNISTDKVIDALERIDISGILTPHPKGYQFNISNKEWVMFGENWTFNDGNNIIIGDRFLDISNLQLTDGYRFITLSDIENQGVYASLNNFNFLRISELIDYDKMSFEGDGDVELKARNIYDKPSFDLSLNVPEFTVNKDPYGSLKVELRKAVDKPAKVSMSLNSDTFQLGVNGSYDDVNDVIDGDLTGRGMPLNLMEYIIDTGISSTHGMVDLDIILSGGKDDPKFNGNVFFRDCGSTIDYIGVHYTFNDQLLKVSDKYMDFSGMVLQDPEGNKGVIQGGLRHSFIKDFRMEIDMLSNDIIVLNTTRADNPLYYGFGKGKMDVSFRGPFSVADMTINATTGPRTILNVPVQNSYYNYEESFIEFINKDDLYKEGELIKEEFKIEGLDVQMNLSLTDDAEMNIIFNEKLKDIITGRGNGDLQIAITRSGEFNVFGDYVIENGEYLFTAFNVVNKPFKIRKGSTIRWTGDPIDADLDIASDYENVRSSLTVFLAEYLTAASQSVINEAKRNTDVDLSLLIGGSLFQPEINFDLDFPSLQPGELKSYVDSKVRTLRANPNLLNDQVAGLILWRTFLPYNNPLGNSVLSSNNLIQSGSSTLTEFFSQQFSQVLSGFVNAALPENEIISSVDLEIGLNKNVNILDAATDASVFDFINPDEIQLRLNPRFKFLGERLSAKVGGNYVKESDLIAQSAFIPDVTIEYDLTEDGKLKLRFSYIYDFEQRVINNAQSRRQRYGLGISVRHEFGKVLAIQNGIKDAVEQAIIDQNN